MLSSDLLKPKSLDSSVGTTIRSNSVQWMSKVSDLMSLNPPKP